MKLELKALSILSHPSSFVTVTSIPIGLLPTLNNLSMSSDVTSGARVSQYARRWSRQLHTASCCDSGLPRESTLAAEMLNVLFSSVDKF